MPCLPSLLLTIDSTKTQVPCLHGLQAMSTSICVDTLYILDWLAIQRLVYTTVAVIARSGIQIHYL